MSGPPQTAHIGEHKERLDKAVGARPWGADLRVAMAGVEAVGAARHSLAHTHRRVAQHLREGVGEAGK